VRLWTIRSGECENTFDEHENRVWALAVSPDGGFVSGGSDGKIVMWTDVTEAEERVRVEALEHTLLAEQQLNNDMKHKRYDKVTTTTTVSACITPITAE
jgi:U3 small nucleolar RNA-associated protein 13